MDDRLLRPAIALALLGAAALALTGCAAPGGEPDPGSSDEADSSVGGLTTDPGCLVGDWHITQEQMQSFYDAVAAESGGGLAFAVDGGTGLSFTETRYEYTPGYSLELDLGGAGSTGTGSITGSLRGDYAAADGVITTEHDESDIAMTVEVGGIEMDASDLFASILEMHPINDAPYECTGESIVIQFKTVDARVPITLVPAT